MTVQRLFLMAAFLGFLAVALGAFGAHGLKAVLEAANQLENWKTAVFYQLVHAVALISLTGGPIDPIRLKAGWCWIAGVLLFSGSLYWIAVGGPVKLLWPITPLGGLFLLTGWALLAWSAVRRSKA